MKTKEQIILLSIAAVVIALVIGIYQLKVHFFGEADKDNEPVKTEFFANHSPDSCTFYNELISLGVTEEEAMYNIECCKDKNCPYHHKKLITCFKSRKE